MLKVDRRASDPDCAGSLRRFVVRCHSSEHHRAALQVASGDAAPHPLPINAGFRAVANSDCLVVQSTSAGLAVSARLFFGRLLMT